MTLIVASLTHMEIAVDSQVTSSDGLIGHGSKIYHSSTGVACFAGPTQYLLSFFDAGFHQDLKEFVETYRKIRSKLSESDREENLFTYVAMITKWIEGPTIFYQNPQMEYPELIDTRSAFPFCAVGVGHQVADYLLVKGWEPTKILEELSQHFDGIGGEIKCHKFPF